MYTKNCHASMKHENHEIIHPPHRRQWSVWTWNTENTVQWSLLQPNNSNVSIEAQHSLPGCFSHAAAARLLVIRRGMKVLLLWLPAGTAEEIPDPLLPCRSGTRTHGIPSGILALGWPKQTQQTPLLTWTHTPLLLKNIDSKYWPDIDSNTDAENKLK